MIRTIRVSVACVAVLWAVAAQAQNGARTTKEGMLREKEAAAAALAAPRIAADKQNPRIGGFWEPEKSVKALLTVEGKDPPLTAAGKQLQRKRMAQIRAGKSDDPMNVCLPPGTPRDMLSPGP